MAGRKGVRGEPSRYTEAIADEICERIASGESLMSICSDPRMPNDASVRGWVMNDRANKNGLGKGFAARYAKARELGYDHMAESLIAIGDADYKMPDGTVDNGAIQQARLRSDNRRWLLSKVMPRKYGDRITTEVVGDADQPVLQRIELVAVPAAKVIDAKRVADGVVRGATAAADYARGRDLPPPAADD